MYQAREELQEMVLQDVRKQEPNRVRLTIDVPRDLRREIRTEAAQMDVTVREYVTELILRARHDQEQQD